MPVGSLPRLTVPHWVLSPLSRTHQWSLNGTVPLLQGDFEEWMNYDKGPDPFLGGQESCELTCCIADISQELDRHS